jgi:quinolinate synthase
MAILASSVEETFQKMKKVLSRLVPEVELCEKAELVFEINRLKKEKNAVILGHNYMEAALFHTVPDFTGDSLGLCRLAEKTEADVIIFCGVGFMAETAKILNPQKTVLIPSEKAGCSLAESITAEQIRRLKERFPGVPVVTYVNTFAEVKAETDICCTSSNAVKVVESLDSDTVIFLPDKFLGQNVARETGKTILFPLTEGGEEVAIEEYQGKMLGWQGRCEVHEQFTVEDVTNARKQFPDVVVLAHPECPPEVVEASDFNGSTGAMVDWVRDNEAPHYLLLTECSMGDNVIAEMPGRDILRLCSLRCPHMAEITLEDTLEALRQNRFEVTMDEDLRLRAKGAVDRMLEIG